MTLPIVRYGWTFHGMVEWQGTGTDTVVSFDIKSLVKSVADNARIHYYRQCGLLHQWKMRDCEWVVVGSTSMPRHPNMSHFDFCFAVVCANALEYSYMRHGRSHCIHERQSKGTWWETARARYLTSYHLLLAIAIGYIVFTSTKQWCSETVEKLLLFITHARKQSVVLAYAIGNGLPTISLCYPALRSKIVLVRRLEPS